MNAENSLGRSLISEFSPRLLREQANVYTHNLLICLTQGMKIFYVLYMLPNDASTAFDD
jgi:hypothetical protein